MQRVLAGGDGELIDKALEHEAEAVAARGSHGSGGNAEGHVGRAEEVVRDEAGGELFRNNVGGSGEALAFAVADEVVAPGDQLSGCVDAALQVMEAAGTIEVVRHVVFAGP